MSQLVTLRSGYEDELAVVLINNNAIHALRENDPEVYEDLINLCEGFTEVSSDTCKVLLAKYLITIEGGKIYVREVVRAIVASSVREDLSIEELPYDC